MGMTAETDTLFPRLSDEQIACLLPHGSELRLKEGDTLFTEGDPEQEFYVILEGGLRVTRQVAGSDVTLASHQPGEFTGALSMLAAGGTSIATGRATGSTRLLRIGEADFEKLFVHCPEVARFLLTTMAQRRPEADALSQQREKLAALGKLSAGLAHELNNPSAAVSRAADQLRVVFETMQPIALRLGQSCLSPDFADTLRQFQQEAATRMAQDRPPLGTLEQSDREDALADWMNERVVPEGWKLAPAFVSADLTVDDLQPLTDKAAPEALGDVLAWVEVSLQAQSLIQEIASSSERISTLVQSVKSYAYRDEAPRQDIDIHQGLESTLVMLGHRLRNGNIEIIRDFDRDLPLLPAFGSELNQVWTNLLDNAIGALEEAIKSDPKRPKPQITIHTAPEGDSVLVVIEDNGPGIPADIQSRIFEPFFTTKGVGEGSGLGLEIAHRIVTVRHKGDIRVVSEPGRTRFEVRLPLKAAAEADGSL